MLINFSCKKLPSPDPHYNPIEWQSLATERALLNKRISQVQRLQSLHIQLPIVLWVMEEIPYKFNMVTEVFLL